MIDWFGPIVHEYYAGSEQVGMTVIRADEWLAHPGSVGRGLGCSVHILDDECHEVGPGAVGNVYFESPTADFAYLNDPEQSRSARSPQGWATLGDVGYLDGDGYLHLTDRATYMIISGGVNIYPREVEDALVSHPAVADAAVFGIPDAEMGEQVKAVVQLERPDLASPELAAALIEHCRGRIAHYKCPRSIDFEARLPRADTGKLLKRVLRDRYWQGHDERIG
jgi:acyl-CoA synthetase (AMP-forming)/AMP-acid ligase II